MTPRDEKIILIALACCVGIVILGTMIGYLWNLIYS